MAKLLGLPMLGGNHNLVKYRNLRIWAERGLIRIEDARDNSYEILSFETAHERVSAINDIVKRSLQIPEVRKYKDEIEAMQDFVSRMIDVMQAAREQGMPTDASARRDLKRRQPKSVSVPCNISMD